MLSRLRGKKYTPDINIAHSWQVETKEDMDRYPTALRKRLEQEIEENIINIEF